MKNDEINIGNRQRRIADQNPCIRLQCNFVTAIAGMMQIAHCDPQQTDIQQINKRLAEVDRQFADCAASASARNKNTEHAADQMCGYIRTIRDYVQIDLQTRRLASVTTSPQNAGASNAQRAMANWYASLHERLSDANHSMIGEIADFHAFCDRQAAKHPELTDDAHRWGSVIDDLAGELPARHRHHCKCGRHCGGRRNRNAENEGRTEVKYVIGGDT